MLHAAREVCLRAAHRRRRAHRSPATRCSTSRPPPAPPRLLPFETATPTIELELDPSGRRLLGQLDPAAEADLELRVEGAVVATARSDALGRFVLPRPTGATWVSVRCRSDAGPVVVSTPTVV